MKSTIFGFVGGPGIGKSYQAHYWTAALKGRGYSTYFAQEVAKRRAEDGVAISAYDELAVTGMQIGEESRMLGRVEYIIAERPVLLSLAYAAMYAPISIRMGVISQVAAYYTQLEKDGHHTVFIPLQRVHEYETAGRFEKKETATDLDGVMLQRLGEHASMYDCDVVSLAHLGTYI